MDFDWDRANVAHIARHRVTPDEAEQAPVNDAFDVNYEVVGGEKRWTSLGHTNSFRVLVVVWSLRGDAIRHHRAGRWQEAPGRLLPGEGVV
jgi:uncharacterized DUF497 family protein